MELNNRGTDVKWLKNFVPGFWSVISKAYAENIWGLMMKPIFILAKYKAEK